ncbi:TVP38/TMEM64 family protein [Alteribacter lacisalsi]|uniref:TVP38/TMEM64 family membrane protein n=1 Tax=Alteribacter lacisalsi TaxID=2045244 RepID=A0A2W0HIH8_9BACI|nr:TVP38/TMEM64 family protein [Alteribacter lacisalsi]PYZ97265.1 TVP38/TMEM64 family protein [Alteribacter lacisalsi]
MSKKKIILYSCLAGVIAFLFYINRNAVQVSTDDIRTWILSFGWFSPVVYILLYTVRPLVLFPASVLSIAGGLAFGPFYGTVYTLIGATGSAASAFITARVLGKNIAGKEWKGRYSQIQKQLEERGFFYVLLLRIIPVFNFDLISYASGISKVRFSPFVTATAIGMVPGVFAYTYLGSSLVDGGTGTWVFAGSLFLIVILVPVFFRGKVKRMLGMGKKDTTKREEENDEKI